jgi:hypothetical protein
MKSWYPKWLCKWLWKGDIQVDSLLVLNKITDCMCDVNSFYSAFFPSSDYESSNLKITLKEHSINETLIPSNDKKGNNLIEITASGLWEEYHSSSYDDSSNSYENTKNVKFYLKMSPIKEIPQYINHSDEYLKMISYNGYFYNDNIIWEGLTNGDHKFTREPMKISKELIYFLSGYSYLFLVIYFSDTT